MQFPYEKYRGSDAWKTIDSALSRLEQNGDFKLTTAQEYITGYLCKALSKNGALKIQKIKKRLTSEKGTANKSSERKNKKYA